MPILLGRGVRLWDGVEGVEASRALRHRVGIVTERCHPPNGGAVTAARCASGIATGRRLTCPEAGPATVWPQWGVDRLRRAREAFAAREWDAAYARVPLRAMVSAATTSMRSPRPRIGSDGRARASSPTPTRIGFIARRATCAGRRCRRCCSPAISASRAMAPRPTVGLLGACGSWPTRRRAPEHGYPLHLEIHPQLAVDPGVGRRVGEADAAPRRSATGTTRCSRSACSTRAWRW